MTTRPYVYRRAGDEGSREAQQVAIQKAAQAGENARAQLAELEELRDSLLGLAQEAYIEAAVDLKVGSERLREFDEASDRVLAETGGRVRSIFARISHAKASAGPVPADLSELEAELQLARTRDDEQLAARLSEREWIAREVRVARVATLQAGAIRLALSERLVPLLLEIARVAERAQAKNPDARDNGGGGSGPLNGASSTGPVNGASVHRESAGGPGA